jgi:hypothetical protein
VQDGARSGDRLALLAPRGGDRGAAPAARAGRAVTGAVALLLVVLVAVALVVGALVGYLVARRRFRRGPRHSSVRLRG